MALTVTYREFKDLTERAFPRYRSSYQNAVLDALKAYERTPSGLALVALRAALREWKSNKATEFANRDELSKTRQGENSGTVPSHGLCTQLVLEVGLYPNWITKPEIDVSAQRITLPLLRRAAYALRTPNDRGTAIGVAYENLAIGVAQALEAAPDTAVVVLIDMEGTDGLIAPDRAANHGFHARFDELSVLEHQLDVLQTAAVRGVPVYDVTTVAHNARTVNQLSGVFEHLDVTSYKKTANNPFAGGGATRTNGTTLRTDLEAQDRRVAIVMGYHANQCVNSTIFGNAGLGGLGGIPSTTGLLQLGFDVITSRNVLASDNNAPLQPEYGPIAG